MSDTSSITTGADNTQMSDNSHNTPIFACPKCKATKIAKSHPKSLDGLYMRFIPKRPYRCLHCYHRFWKWESLFASAKRIWAWSIILALIVATLLLQMRSPNSEEIVIGPFYDANDSSERVIAKLPDVNDPIATREAAMENSAPKQASRINTRNAPLSSIQLEKQLAQARAEARQAKQQNEARKISLQETMQAEQAELESLLKIDIGYHLENWRKAWQAGDVARYLSFYSEDFIPRNELSRERWVELRRDRISPAKKIVLRLSNFKVEFIDNNAAAIVAFDQAYQAGSYQDVSRKKLLLLKERQEWKITSETEITK